MVTSRVSPFTCISAVSSLKTLAMCRRIPVHCLGEPLNNIYQHPPTIPRRGFHRRLIKFCKVIAPSREVPWGTTRRSGRARASPPTYMRLPCTSCDAEGQLVRVLLPYTLGNGRLTRDEQGVSLVMDSTRGQIIQGSVIRTVAFVVLLVLASTPALAGGAATPASGEGTPVAQEGRNAGGGWHASA